MVLQDPQAPSDHQEDKGQLEHQRVEDPLVHKAQLVPQDLMVVKEWSD